MKVLSNELPQWNKAGDPLRPVEGLTRRRKAEVDLAKKTPSAIVNCSF